MKSFRERGEVRFRRSEFAHQFCVGAELPIVFMGFFDAQSRSFTETWIGRADGASKEFDKDLIKSTEGQLAVWAVLQTEEAEEADSEDGAVGAGDILTWMNAGDYIVGVGAPVKGIYPIMALRRGEGQKLPAREFLLRMGMSFVTQQLTEEIYERSVWMENLVETATQVLSIQFLVVTAEGDIKYDSRQTDYPGQQNTGWLVSNGRLSWPSAKDGQGLQDAVREAASEKKRSSIVSIFTSAGVARLVVVTPLHGAEDGLALVLFESSDTDHFKLREQFFNAYRLTKSESTIAHEILSGRSIAEAAEAKNLSQATVRSYMKQVLAKTGTHKQSELISLYFSSILPIASNLKDVVDQRPN